MTHIFQIIIKGEIESSWWNCTSDTVAAILDKNQGKKVKVLISSLGGSAIEAFIISSLFKLHGDVEVHYIGNNASAATIASMGASRVTIDSTAMYLVHQCASVQFDWDIYNADQLENRIKQLRETQEDLRKFDDVAASMYAQRCKKPKDELMQLMKRGGWLTAQEALEWGFVDEITDDPRDKQTKSRREITNALANAGLPPLPGAEPEKNLFEKFKNFITEITQNKMDNEDKKGVVEPQAAATEPKNKTAEPAAVDETAAKAAAEIESLKTELAGVKAKLEASEKENERLNGILANKPADTTTTVVSTGAKEEKKTVMDRFIDSASEANAMLAQLP